MSTDLQYTFRRMKPLPTVPHPEDESISYADHLQRFRSAQVTKLVLDQFTHIPTAYRFVEHTRQELIAIMPEIPEVRVMVNLSSGEVSIDVDDSSPYRVVAVEISLPPSA